MKSAYVSTAVKKAQANVTIETPAGPIDVATKHRQADKHRDHLHGTGES